MNHQEKMIDRQVGRNAELFAHKIGSMPTKAERYGYIRILVAIIEQAHSEWNQTPQKPDQVAHLVHRLSHGQVDKEEVKEIVRLRDEERGYVPKKN